LSDTYQALVDPTAAPSNAKARADQILRAFIAHGILSGKMSSDCLYDGVGYLPGPVFDTALGICGVRFVTDKWINMWGFTVYEHSQCPECGCTFSNDSDFMGPLMDAVGNFYNLDEPSMLACPQCQSSYEVQNWITEPHLGLCHLAIEFWNWPDFDRENWKLSIPQIASEAIGRPLITTWGRM